jgi:hypothetical protein
MFPCLVAYKSISVHYHHHPLEIAHKQLMEKEIQLKQLEIYKLKLQLAENRIKDLENMITSEQGEIPSFNL